MDYISTWQEVTEWLETNVTNYPPEITKIDPKTFYRFVGSGDYENPEPKFDDFV